MSKDTETDILVAGAGPAGMIAALALARAGFGVTLTGPDVGYQDRRTTALMVPALEFLAGLGLGDAIRQAGAPLAAMRIIDATTLLIRSPIVTFRASEIGEPYFGLNIPNAALNAALAAAIASERTIVRKPVGVIGWTLGGEQARATLDNGEQIAARLAVGADGRNSPVRQAAGIAVHGNSLPQSALVLTFAHSRPHASISTEFHTETGPFTQVPLAGDRSSLVWVTEPDHAAQLLALSDADLSAQVEQCMQSMLGRVTVEQGRQIYPLTASTPARFARNRVALVGEAAHIFPPIGAQGLNLGIRDVADLIQIAAQFPDDPGSDAALNAYDAKRRPDILARSAAVGLLNRSLLSDLLPAQMARSAGLGVLGALSPLRVLFMREGLRPGSGFGSALSDLREQIRR